MSANGGRALPYLYVLPAFLFFARTKDVQRESTPAVSANVTPSGASIVLGGSF